MVVVFVALMMITFYYSSRQVGGVFHIGQDPPGELLPVTLKEVDNRSEESNPIRLICNLS